ncbi:MAG: SDR family oxidoreductase [Acidimicrobiales bacterium]
MTSPDLGGRCAIVTGASRGIGLAVASDLAAAGASVVLTGRNLDAIEEAIASIGGVTRPFAANVGDPQAAARCVEFAMREFGRVDILVNNAGTNPAYGPAMSVEHGAFAKTIEVNLWAPLMWTQLVWNAWMCSNGGSIVNVSSLGAFVTDRDTSIYAASKAALNHLTAHLALELAPRVRVNAVAPGLVRTKLASSIIGRLGDDFTPVVPMGRLGEGSDVAAVVVFLASDQASWVTGSTIVVDGGMRLQTPQNLLADPSANEQ